jgi:glutamine amidotransferase
MTRINEAGIDADNDPSPDGIAAVLGASIGELASRCESAGAEDPPRLNTVLTNGHIMVGTRWNNDLYAVVREGVRDCEICGIPHVHHDKSIDYRAVIVASEPISHETWQEVPNHSVFAVGQDIDLTIRPIQSLPSRTVIF